MVWNRLAYLYASMTAAAIGLFLIHVPFTVGEIVTNLLQSQGSPPASRLFIATFTNHNAIAGFLRPFSYATTKLVFDLSQGHYFAVYRGLTIAMVLLLLVLFVRLLRVESATTLALALVSTAALIGLHTFYQTVRETELNIKLIIPVLCFGALNLSASKPAWWKDALAVLLTFYGVFANELGILVWVVLVAAYIVGFRGVSRYAVIGASVVLGVYLYLRLVQWDVGAPSLSDRSSGFGFRVLDPPEIIARFGANPYPFYAYNVMAAAFGILFSEPTTGAFLFTRDLLASEATMWQIVNVTTSVITTSIMIWFVGRRWRLWLKRDFSYEDRLFLVFVAVCAGNAAISFPYVKDVTLSTGGAFYALGVFVVLQSLVTEMSDRTVTALRAAFVCGLLACVSLGWAVRGAWFYVDMNQAAYKAKSDWIEVYTFLDEQHMQLENAEQKHLIESLRIQMTALPPPELPLLELFR